MNTTLVQIVREEMKPDGALRDIYIEGVSLADWDRFLTWITTRGGTYGFAASGSETWSPEMPTASILFSPDREDLPGLLFLKAGGGDLCCHFFCAGEIELDLDPKDFQCDANIQALLGFMQSIGDLLRKDVLFCYENWKNALIVTYSPEMQSFHHRQKSEQSDAGNRAEPGA